MNLIFQYISVPQSIYINNSGFSPGNFPNFSLANQFAYILIIYSLYNVQIGFNAKLVYLT